MSEYVFKIGGKEYRIGIQAVDNKLADVSVNGTSMKVEISSLPVIPSSNVHVVNPGAVMAPNLPMMTAMAAGGAMPASDSAPAAQPQTGGYQKSKRPTTAIKASEAAPASIDTKNAVKADLPGLIIDVLVSVGDQVAAGDSVAKIEAMKMENDIPSKIAGTVKAILIKKGDSVQEGDPLVIIE